MKTILTAALPRTGSTFFHQHIPHIDGEIYNSMEFYNEWIPRQLQHIKASFFKYNIPISPAYQTFLTNLIKGKSKIDQLYNINMIESFGNIINNHHYKFFFHKLIINDFVTTNIYWKILESSCDKCVILYRKDILKNYISFTRATNSGLWILTDKQSKHSNYDENKYNEPIKWNKAEYLDHASYYIGFYNDLINKCKELDKPYKLITFEDFCLIKNKQQYFTELYEENFTIAQPVTKKQSTSKNIEDAFSNTEIFEKEYVELEPEFKILSLDKI